MIGHRIGQIEPAKPPIRQIDMDLFAEPPLGPDAHAIAQQQHTDHQLGIGRRAAARAVERRQQRPHMRQIEEPVDTAHRVIQRHEPFDLELLKQRALRDLPWPHHRDALHSQNE